MSAFLRSAPVQRLARPLRRHLERHSIRVAREQVGRLRAEILGDAGANERQLAPAGRSDDGRRLDELRSEIAALRLDRELDAQRLNDLAAKLDGIRGQLDEMVAQLEAAGSSQPDLEARVRHVTLLVERFRCSLQLLLGPTGRQFSRVVSDDDVDRLMSELETFGDPRLVGVAIGHAYRTLVDIELRCVGRCPGSTSNILARLAAVMLLPPPSGEVLELGTRYGTVAVGLLRQLARRGVDAHLTLVGSFSGELVESASGTGPDASLTPVTRDAVVTNLALGGATIERCRLVDGTSEARDVRSIVDDRRYGLVVSEGRPSEDGTLDELVWVESIALPGAVVMIGGIGDPAWPGGERALDRYCSRPDARLRLVGRASTTAFLRAT